MKTEIFGLAAVLRHNSTTAECHPCYPTSLCVIDFKCARRRATSTHIGTRPIPARKRTILLLRRCGNSPDRGCKKTPDSQSTRPGANWRGITAPVRETKAAYAPAGSTVHGEENPGLAENGCSALPGKTHQLGFPISLFPRSHPSNVFGPELLFLALHEN